MGTSDLPARVVGLNHIALEVGDIEQALAFYGSLFALTMRGREGDSMAFVDLGDQFIALVAPRCGPPDADRHFGLVVDDQEAVRVALEPTSAEILTGPGLSFRDPWGNHVQVVQYDRVQFTKAPDVLNGMGLDSLAKTDAALHELREKGLAQ